MRLHRLDITAFGPFSDAVGVDFDDLSEAGLFLLSGPTGAGKSSVLDAVCFALYGAVPGARDKARQLRCDVAPPELAPRVVLEASLGRRRLRFTRSPAWERPKRRGTGTTSQQSTVLVEEHRDSSWQHVTGRIDEAGQLVGHLLGLTLDQFCQVVLLPQGEFQRFLRAPTADRQRLLQSIFRTERYAQIERWLAERRSALRRTALEHSAGVADLVSRVSETAGEPAPDGLDDARDPAVDPAPAQHWAMGLLGSARAAAEQCTAALGDAVQVAEAADAAVGRARTDHELRERHRSAVAGVAELEARGDQITALRDELEAGRRALPLRPLIDAALEASAAQAAAESSRREAVAALGGQLTEASGMLDLDVPGDTADVAVGPEQVERELEHLGARRDRARTAAEAERDAVRLRDELAALDRDLARVTIEVETLTADQQHLPARLAGLAESSTRAQQGAAALPGAQVGLARALEVLEAAQRAARLVPVRLAAEDDHLAARRATLDAREHFALLREQRLEGMAAEIAVGLAVGDACPVCGSCSHPRPAQAETGVALTGAEAERAARATVDDAEVAEQAYADHLREVTAQAAAAAEASGGLSPDDARAAVAELRAQVDRAGACAAEHERLQGETAQVRERADHLGAELERARVRRAALDGERRALLQRLDGLDRTVRRLCTVEEVDDVTAALAAIAEATRAWQALGRALEAEQRARDASLSAAVRADDAVAEAGFDDLSSARAALPAPGRAAQIEQRLQRHDAALVAHRTVLDDPAVRAAAQAPAPDLDLLERERAHARARLDEAGAAHAVAQRRADRLGELANRLGAAIEAQAPVREAFLVADRMAGLTGATSSENARRVRLAAYVLAWRLAQVVAAANLRLAPMSDGRYQIEQADDGTAARGGLGLLVRDEWSGSLRDPATLSGGETFLVSLALALGLADVATAEAPAEGRGGDIETLFVDEGFGSLDAETLEQVMDALDALRDGGRVVGVVSHVAELRSRVPTQLVVTPGRGGSTLRLVESGAA